MVGIYKIQSPSSKIYIGQSIDIYRRKKFYKKGARKSQIKIYNSIKKYGFKNHTFEVVEICDIEKLNERERYWQEFYDSVKNGLNCRYQGYDGKSGKLSKETINKMKKKDVSYLIGNDHRKGIAHSKEIKDKISKSLKGVMVGEKNPMYGKTGDNNPMYGKKHSKEVRKKISIKSKNNIKNIENLKSYNEVRKIILLDTESGVYYDSISEASQIINIKYTTLKAMLSGRNRNKTNLIKV